MDATVKVPWQKMQNDDASIRIKKEATVKIIRLKLQTKTYGI